jgi:hypothetical protein
MDLVMATTAKTIYTHYPSLDLEQVHAALSYYYGHKDEIEAELREDESSEDNFEKTKAEFLARRGR